MAKRAAGFVIFHRFSNTIQYLLLQASYGDRHWTPPKGHVDPGEDDYTTAIRETLEETGLQECDLKVLKDISKSLTYQVKGKPKIVTYWLAELINPEKNVILSEEHQALKWLNLKDACELGKYLEMKELLEFCDSHINK